MKISVEQAANGYIVRDDVRHETFVVTRDDDVSFAWQILDAVLGGMPPQLHSTASDDPRRHAADRHDGSRESAPAVDEKRMRGWAPHEISSIYAMDIHRYVVSLIVTYDDSKRSDRKAGIENIHSPAAAAAATLDLTRDSGSAGTVWRVFDRKTGTVHTFAQREFEKR